MNSSGTLKLLGVTRILSLVIFVYYSYVENFSKSEVLPNKNSTRAQCHHLYKKIKIISRYLIRSVANYEAFTFIAIKKLGNGIQLIEGWGAISS